MPDAACQQIVPSRMPRAKAIFAINSYGAPRSWQMSHVCDIVIRLSSAIFINLWVVFECVE